MIVLPDAEGLARAVRLLRAGSVVAFPTETVYGLGADAFSETAVAEIYRLKNRPSWNPLIVHVASVEAARELASAWPDKADKLAVHFWPGPLTLVVRRGQGTLAIRIPAHDVALRLLDAVGIPLAAPSANRSEGISPTTAEHVVRSLPDVPLVLDVTGDVPRLLRPGALGLRAIRDVIGPVSLPEGVDDGVQRPSPGMSRRHYAPRARLVLVDEIKDLDGYAQPVGVLTHEGLDPDEYAADLYAALHRLDDDGVATIVALAPPATEEWLAVRDRLSRAAAR